MGGGKNYPDRDRFVPGQGWLVRQADEEGGSVPSRIWKDRRERQEDRVLRGWLAFKHPLPSSVIPRDEGNTLAMADLVLQLRVVLRWQICVAVAMLICSMVRGI